MRQITKASNVARKNRAVIMEAIEPRQLFSVVVLTPSSSIQTAVNNAHNGDTILLKAGTYTQQVTIPSTKKNITIASTGNGIVTIKAPAVLSGGTAIIHDAGSLKFDIAGITVAGPAAGLQYGILVDQGGSATIEECRVTGIQDTALALDSRIVAINVASGYGRIVNTTIDHYERAGIRIGPLEDLSGNPIIPVGPAASADISNVSVTGIGPSTIVLQNGIEFTYGASGTLSCATVTGNIFKGTTFSAEGTGIFILDSRSVSISNVLSYKNDEDIAIDAGKNLYGGSFAVQLCGAETYGATFDGIGLFDGVHGVVVNNVYSHNNGLDGIIVDAASTGDIIENSTFDRNAVSGTGYDAEDDTYNPAQPVKKNNAGTANTWIGNVILTSNDKNLVSHNSHGYGY